MNNNNENIFKDKEKKKNLIILAVFSFAIIFISILSLRDSIMKPFDIKLGESSEENQSTDCSGGSCEVSGESGDLTKDNADLKLIDTDGDTLSDWDELFIYETSPYLEDTDGDGLTDYEEIKVYNTNPNCPEGEDCSSFVSSPTSENVDTSTDNSNADVDLESNANELLELLESSSEEEEVTQEQEAFSELYDISPEELRTELLNAGIAQEDLDVINDEDLLDIYRESLLDSL
jgi:hypothetical protein